jgi:hypothetical protein
MLICLSQTPSLSSSLKTSELLISSAYAFATCSCLASIDYDGRELEALRWDDF